MIGHLTSGDLCISDVVFTFITMLSKLFEKSAKMGFDIVFSLT